MSLKVSDLPMRSFHGFKIGGVPFAVVEGEAVMGGGCEAVDG